MWKIILEAFSVYISSAFKFIFGPLLGMKEDLHIAVTIIATSCGMMTAVIIFAFFGDFLRRRVFPIFRRKTYNQTEELKNFEKKAKWKTFYSRYGLGGIAFLTPILLTPIGGTLLAVAFGSPRPKILIYMLISASIWSVILTFSVYLGHDWLVDHVKWFSNVPD